MKRIQAAQEYAYQPIPYTPSKSLVKLKPAGSRPLEPRIKELGQLLSTPADRKAGIAELALLSTSSETARKMIVSCEVESKIISALLLEREPEMQIWLMSILANLAQGSTTVAGSSPARERQSGAIPVLCQLVRSSHNEVQSAAALHLATLSHSEHLAGVIGKKNGTVLSLKSLEQADDPNVAQFARWTLRTAQGRNYKPEFQPKPPEQVAAEEAEEAAEAAEQAASALKMQTKIRGKACETKYKQFQLERKLAATNVQKTYRGHNQRAKKKGARQLEPAFGLGADVLASAAAAVQSRYRGHLARVALGDPVAIAEEKAEQAARAAAATAMQANYRGHAARGKKSESSDRTPVAADTGRVSLDVIYNDDGTVSLDVGFDEAAAEGAVNAAADGGVGVNFLYHDDGTISLDLTVDEDVAEGAADDEAPAHAALGFVLNADGTVQLTIGAVTGAPGADGAASVGGSNQSNLDDRLSVVMTLTETNVVEVKLVVDRDDTAERPGGGSPSVRGVSGSGTSSGTSSLPMPQYASLSICAVEGGATLSIEC